MLFNKVTHRLSKLLIRAFFILLLSAFYQSSFAEVVFNRGNSAEPSSLDPSYLQTLYEGYIVDDLFTGLMTYNAKGKLIPGIAKSWVVSKDGKTYTFTLGHYKWSNGAPITALDAKFGIMRTLNPNTAAPLASILFPIQGAQEYNSGKAKANDVMITVDNPQTLTIKLKKPTPYFLSLLGNQESYPQPQKIVEQYGDAWIKPQNIITSGAYTLAQWKANAYIKLVRNKNFYDNKNVQIDTVYYYPTQDKSTSWLAFKNGELDYENDAKPEQLQQIKKYRPNAIKTQTVLAVYYYTFNMRKKPFDDIRVRQALAMTIDRQDIAQSVMLGTVKPAYSLIMKGMPNYTQPPQVMWKDWSWDKRVKQAQKLLKEAGFDREHPLKFKIRYNSDKSHKLIAIEISSIWKETLGVQAKLFNTDAKVHFSDLNKGKFEVARDGYAADFADPKSILFVGESKTGPQNHAGYHNPEFDSFMQQASTEIDLNKRAQLMAKAEAILLRDEPYTPIYFYAVSNLVAPYVKGYYSNPMQRNLTRYLRVEKH